MAQTTQHAVAAATGGMTIALNKGPGMHRAVAWKSAWDVRQALETRRGA
jgi:hypothetical protein